MLVNLKMAIGVRHLKQVDLAQMLKISPTVLSEIIHERRRADASLRARIATALKADERWLFSTVARIPEPVFFRNTTAEPTPEGPVFTTVEVAVR